MAAGPRRQATQALLLLLLGGATSAYAQTPMSGAYTINSAQPTAGTNFTSFTDAATALTTNGVSGPVNITVSGGPYTEQFRLTALTGSSATNRVTINGGGSTIRFGSTNSAQRAVVMLDGADYVTVNNLVIDATNNGTPGTYGWGVQLVNGADNDVINGCTVTTTTNSTSTNFVGIGTSASTTASTTSGANSNQNVTITNNTVTGGYYCITGVGVSTAAPSTGLVINNNTVRDFAYYGIYVSYQNAPQVIGNDVARPTAGITTSTFYGLYIITSVNGAAVEKNRIHDPFPAGNTSTSTVYAIYSSSTAATASSPNDFVNNVVYNLNGAGAHYAIYNTGADYSRYYYNTINIDDQTNAGSANSYGFYQTSGENVDFKNNVVRVTRTGSGTHYAMYFSSTAGITSSNYNDLSGSGANFRTGYYPSTARTTLADWKTVNNAAYDQNSTDADPVFVDPSTGNLRPTSGSLNGAATPLTRVPQDITGATRSTTAPDLGAYEFTPPANDAALVSIDSPASPVTTGAKTVTVTVRNNGASVLNSLRLSYTLNSGTPVVQNFTSLNLASGATRQLTFTTQATLVTGSNTLTVASSLPNGTTDANPGNDTQSTTLYTALSGTYTINQSAPASSTNFTSFSDAATALNSAGIASSVRFNVLNGPYTEQLLLGQITGASATDTIVFDGGTSKQTISFAGTSTAQMATVQLNGSDYVTLQNLTVEANGATIGVGIHLVGQANNNRVANCVVRASTTSTGSSSVALAASGTATSTTSSGDANNLTLSGNVFSGGYYCVILTGLSTTTRSTGIRVLNNEIRDFYFYGLDVEYSNGPRLIGNNIHRTNRAGVSTFYGIYSYYLLGAAVEGNRIHDTFTGNPSSTSTAYGLYSATNDAVAGNENDYVNNALYNFNGGGIEYGIYNSGSDFNRYYHNTVALDNTAAAGSTAAYGFYQSTLATGIDFRNNLVSVTRGGSGNRFALYFSTSTSTITSNYNDLFVGTGSNYFTGYYSGNKASLADWKAANNSAYDQNSIQADPLFRDVATGNLQPTSVQLDGTGTPALLTRVPRDIAGTTRVSPPDAGAYELLLVANDVAVLSIDAPVTPAVLGTNPVTVTIRNGGTAVLNSVTLAYTLTGGGTPASNSQTFTGLNLAAGADRQLTFTTGITLTQIGTYTLTVTGSLPNGLADGNAANNTQTVTFDQLTPPNDEPCSATPLAVGTSITSSNANSTTSNTQSGIQLPACSPAQSPRDVWFSFTATTSTTTLAISGNAAGMVRLYTAATCSTGFVPVFCQSSGTANTSVGNVNLTGLVTGQRYYVAISGYSSGETGGAFTIGLGALSSQSAASAAALTVYPNPSATGQLAVKLQGYSGTATVELVNALGQVVRQEVLSLGTEQQLTTRGLAAGLYSLRIHAGHEVLTRKVVLQ